MHAFHTGYPRPAAIHMEPQTSGWMSSADIGPGERLSVGHHAEACARLLAGAPFNIDHDLYATGLLDEYPEQGRAAFIASALHPDVRLITLSSTQMFMHSFSYKDYVELTRPVVLKAAGNHGDDWLSGRCFETLSGEVYMPGFLRVGECDITGQIGEHSQFSGPAFVCAHPDDMKAILGGMPYNATKEDTEKFLVGNHNPYLTYFSEQRRTVFANYEPPEEDTNLFPGTSAAAPCAGSLVMRHTAAMKGITSYDIIPSILMAAQMNEPPAESLKIVETQAGFLFDPFQYGHGVLTERCLAQRLRDVWQVRSMSGKATQSGEYSQPMTIEGRGYMSARTEKAQGPVVNTVLALSFINDKMNGDDTEARIPEFIMLRSPQGTMIPLPLLYDRKVAYGPYVRAGYQTSAFFGEDITKGDWQVMYAQTDENPLRIDSMKIIAHTMHPKSPALVLFRAFQKAVRIERSHEKVTHVTAAPSALKP